jgi:hypothetical protein
MGLAIVPPFLIIPGVALEHQPMHLHSRVDLLHGFTFTSRSLARGADAQQCMDAPAA